MQRHKFARAFKFTSFLTLMLFTILLTGTLYAAPKVGPVTPENSIIGQNTWDTIGSDIGYDLPIYSLPNGNIVVVSPAWNLGRGAVTCLTPAEYKDGGIVITAANSLIGSQQDDRIGLYGIIILHNGNYVVQSPDWDNGTEQNAGAATWVNGNTCFPYGESSRSAVVNPNNSLVGSKSDDWVGERITALSNGNYVVSSPYWENDEIYDAGAVTWGNGETGIAGTITALNSLIGEKATDRIGEGGMVALTNGNYVVSSPYWDNGAISDVGAATWADGETGIVGTLSIANSLIGAVSGDIIGGQVNGELAAHNSYGITALTNGNYVVSSPYWDNGAISNVGAATWADGETGLVGVVSSSNSLIGSSLYSTVASYGVTALSNGNYVINSPDWGNGTVTQVGAVTWGNGTVGAIGTVNATNSLVGSQKQDSVGNGGITALANGNYVISSYYWSNGSVKGVGAITWADGGGSTVGVVSPSNALIGTTTDDMIGANGVIALTNSNYVVMSEYWDNGTIIEAGAVTWGNGSGGTTGVIGAANSLVGSEINDSIGIGGVIALTNGNYVVNSYLWDNGAVADVGAITWGNGSTGTTGAVSITNSLIGSSAGDTIGYGYLAILDDLWNNRHTSLIALANGNYVVGSPNWDNGSVIDAGAATWGDGTKGIVGVVSPTNSFIGLNVGDHVGNHGITALNNGHYLINSFYWDNGTFVDVGAVTLRDGTRSTTGGISAMNSLIGSNTYDGIGQFFSGRPAITPLDDGSFFVSSPNWDNGATETVGAVTWSDGTLPPNSAPVLTEIGNQTADEGEILTFDIEATDIDESALALGYSIIDAPGDASFDTATGVFSWIPDEADGGQTFNVTVTVTDNGEPALSDSESFMITVNEVNDAPVLAEIGDQTVDEGQILMFDAEATDADAPAQTLTFSIEGAPEDATFDTATGEFSWTTDEADGGQTFNVTVTVTDNGQPALNDSETFTITVNEVNNAPVLAEISDHTVDVGATLTFEAEATDSDEPAQTLTYSITGAPGDATFDTASGEFSWTADAADGGQTFNVTVTVADNGEPAESDSEDFAITVNPVIVEEINYLPNASFENPGTTNKTAAGWNGIGLTTNDKRICDTETKTYAHDGECAFRFQFNGASNPVRTLQRTLNAANFAKNEVVELRGMVKANGLTAGARLIVKVVYNNGKTEAVNVKLTAGSYEYSPFATQITLKRPAKKITVQIKAGSAKGVFFVDDMDVVKVATPLTIDGGTTDSGLRGLR